MMYPYTPLTGEAKETHDRLMSMPGNQWPQELKDRVTQERPRNGDALDEIAGRWAEEGGRI